MDPLDVDHLAASVSKESHEAVIKERQEYGGKLHQPHAEVDTLSTLSPENQGLPSLALQQVGFGTVTEWIDGATIQTTTENVKGKEPQASAGFAWSLYSHTLELFSHLIPLNLALSVLETNKQREKSFKKSLGRLFLWGDSFRGGKLESVLDHSDSLRETVIESLAAIGKILLYSKLPIHILLSIARPY
jgi:hypothetical protein